jgi:hypothetical protein
MHGALSHDTEPRGLGSGGNRGGDRPRKVCFRPAWSPRGRHDFPRGAVAVSAQTLRPGAPLFIRRTRAPAWLPRQGGGSTLQRLAPGLLIRPDAMPPLLGDSGRGLRDLTPRRDRGGTRPGGIRLGVAPVFHPMRLSSGLIVNNARHCGGCSSPPPRVCGPLRRPHGASKG